MYIYLIWNQTNGKCYVGQTTKEVDKRFGEHRQRAANEKYVNDAAITKAIKKYGWDAFSKHVLEVCTDQNALNAAEQYWIERLGTMVPLGYNLREGGGSKGKASAETKVKMRLAQLGKKHTDECKAKMGKGRLGKPLSHEHAQKIGAANRGKPKNGGAGFTDDHKIALSKAATKKMTDGGWRLSAGDNNGQAKLTWELVDQIREEKLLTGASNAKLGLKYGVTPSRISMIVNHRAWKPEACPRNIIPR